MKVLATAAVVLTAALLATPASASWCPGPYGTTYWCSPGPQVYRVPYGFVWGRVWYPHPYGYYYGHPWRWQRQERREYCEHHDCD